MTNLTRTGVLIAALAVLLGCGLTSALPGDDEGTSGEPAIEAPAEESEAISGTTETESETGEEASAVETSAQQGELIFTDPPCYISYFPIINGRTTHYTIQSTFDEEDLEFAQTFVVEGPESFLALQTFGDGNVTEVEWQCTDVGLLEADLATANLTDMGTLTYTDLEIEGVTLPPSSDLVEGATWQSVYRAQGETTMESLVIVLDVEMVIDSTYVGIETITVPAGTFETLRIDSILTLTGLMDGVVLIETEIPSSNWYAEDVGLIQSTASDFIIEGDTIQQLVSIEYN